MIRWFETAPSSEIAAALALFVLFFGLLFPFLLDLIAWVPPVAS